MILVNKTVKVKWANKTRKYYENKGYIFTKYGDEFDCNPLDISPGSSYSLPLKCDRCGMEYWGKPKKELTYCKSCLTYIQHEKTYDQRRDSAFDRLEEFCSYKGYKILTPREKYSGLLMNIEYECPLHGIQNGSLGNMIHGHGCIECQYDTIRHTYEEIEENVNLFNNNKLLDVNVITKNNRHQYELLIKCGTCGNNFNITYWGYMHSNHKKCPTCSSSTSGYETIIRNILDANNINYKSEHTFNDCRDINPLPFDFYLKEYNLCIEYDGEFHYFPIRISKEESEEDIQKRFEIRKLHDRIKSEYCLNHGINLLRIPYWEQDNIEGIILNKIQELKKQIA